MRDMIALHASTNLTFENMYRTLVSMWFDEEPFDRGEVHAQKTTEPAMVTRELRDVTLGFDVPQYYSALQALILPNLPWAEDHFQERVSGEPLNPPPAEAWWPYAQQGNAVHKKREKFSHTYPERFWPKMANPGPAKIWHSTRNVDGVPHVGIRFEYGDLEDLVSVLKKNPRSRQAYLPVWFPEDLTAAVKGERVPCTLGYHFMQHPDGKLYGTYYMRSCDLVRFFRDDCYMAGRLLQWVAGCVGMVPGRMRLHISSLHAFVGDEPHLRSLVKPVDKRATYNFEGLL